MKRILIVSIILLFIFHSTAYGSALQTYRDISYERDELIAKLEAGELDAITAGEIDRLYELYIFDYGKEIAEQRAFFLTVFAGVLSLALITTALLLVRNVKLSNKLKEVANYDALTGIFNRRAFMELGLMQIERSSRIKGQCFIIIFDLDHFKAVNDNHGHLAGDKVLVETAQRVKKMIRPYDLFARYGGEEFIILMPDIDKMNVVNAAERIRLDVCKTPVEFEGKEIFISASFGVSYATPVNDMNAAVKYADEALYKAKNEGRNRVVFHEESV